MFRKSCLRAQQNFCVGESSFEVKIEADSNDSTERLHQCQLSIGVMFLYHPILSYYI